MKLSNNKMPKAKQDILPLMDCMFILLIYFIFTMMMLVVTETLPMKLPKLDDKEDNKLTYYSIVITKDNKILWNKSKNPVPMAQLRVELETLLAKDYVPRVFVEADKEAEFGSMIDVLDILRELKILQVSIETDVKDEAII